MKEHNETYYSLEELKRARDCYEGYQDGEEVYYFVGALRYACDEIERLNNIIKEVREYIEKASDNEYSYGDYEIHYEVKKELLEILDKVKNNVL